MFNLRIKGPSVFLYTKYLLGKVFKIFGFFQAAVTNDASLYVISNYIGREQVADLAMIKCREEVFPVEKVKQDVQEQN